MPVKFKDVAHLYLGAECKWKVMGDDEWKDSTIDLKLLDKLFDRQPFEIKPKLYSLKNITQQAFVEFAADVLQADGERIMVAKYNGMWCAASIEITDIEANEKEEIIKEDIDYIIEAEENDHDNVLSYDYKSHSLAYGTSDEMRYFVGDEIQSQWFAMLLKHKYDLFKLIENGEAVEIKR